MKLTVLEQNTTLNDKRTDSFPGTVFFTDTDEKGAHFLVL